MSTRKNKYSKNIFLMRLALSQAKKTLGNTKDNPAVGCVIVKDGSVHGIGNTSVNGRPHAEINAINSLNKNIKNAELYVTLEPCSNYGQTQPCVKTIIKKKINKVFFSIKDPDLKSYNKSTYKFNKNKIKVKSGVCFNEINYFYRSYTKFKKDNLPFVTCKLAISKDLYANSKNNKWITNKFSRGRVHLMRSNHDCIITSIKTIIRNDSTLTCRIKGLESSTPTRIILDKQLKIPINSKIIKTAKDYSTIIFYNESNDKKIKILKKLKVKLIKMPLNKKNNFSLKKILIIVKNHGFSRVFLEAGLSMVNNFLIDNLIDDFILFISNKRLKKYGNNNFKNIMNKFLLKKIFVKESVNLFGDQMITYKIK